MAAEPDALKMSAEHAQGLAPKALAEVLSAWVKAGKVELPAALAQAGNKEVARLAKKALYQLRSKGLAVPEEAPPRKSAPVEAPAKVADDVASGILSHVLGTGERALFFSRPQRGGGLELFQCILHDEQGILQFDRAESNRAAFRRRMKEVRANKEPVVIVDFDRVRTELGRALALNAEAHSPLPKDADSALRRLEITAIEARETVPAAQAADAALAAQGARLFDEAEIGEWLPPEASIKLLSQRVEEVNASPLQLSPAQKAEQLKAKVELTAQEFLTPVTRALYAWRLWQNAEVMEATGRTEGATLARAVARTLSTAAGVPPFIHRFFARVIELSAPKTPAAPPAPSSLILP